MALYPGRAPCASERRSEHFVHYVGLLLPIMTLLVLLPIGKAELRAAARFRAPARVISRKGSGRAAREATRWQFPSL
jgi:hypothetical protein